MRRTSQELRRHHRWSRGAFYPRSIASVIIATRSIVASSSVAALLALCSCDDVRSDLALDAKLRVEGATFHRAAMPAEAYGPSVRAVSVSPIVRPGAIDRTCSGVVDARATAVGLMLEGDPGYWVLPTAPPDVAAPGFPTFAATIAFSPLTSSGARTLITRAVDEDGHFGAPAVRTLDVRAVTRPRGRLVVSLAWDTTADLDLHVTEPSGVEIWKRDPISRPSPAPGQSPTPAPTDGGSRGGALDIDSNAHCIPDGRRAENVVYEDAPPSGTFLVRVDTFSLCDALNAHWHVEALVDGVRIAAAEGVSNEHDTMFPHDRGAGVLALRFDVP